MFSTHHYTHSMLNYIILCKLIGQIKKSGEIRVRDSGAWKRVEYRV